MEESNRLSKPVYRTKRKKKKKTYRKSSDKYKEQENDKDVFKKIPKS